MGVLSRATAIAIGTGLIVAGIASAASPVTVTMIAETRESSYKWQTEMKERFEATHPGITVDLVSVAGTGLIPKMQTMLAGGVPLDIGYMDPYLVVDWGKEGILEDLTPFLAKEQRQYRDWYPASLDLYRVRGGIFGLPQDLQISGIFYNKDQFSEAGLAFPKTSWTYDDLRRNAISLTRREADGTFSRHGFKIPTSRNYVPLVWSYGGDFLDDWADPTRFTGKASETITALEYLADLVTVGAVQDRVTHGRYGVATAFTQRRIAMGLTNTVVMATGFQNITAFDWDVVPLPEGPAGRVPYINGIGWFMFSSSKCKAEAYELLRFLTSTEALERRVQVTGLVPASARVFQTTWLSGQTMPANRHLLLEDFDRARSPWPLHGDIFKIIDREVLSVVWGEKAAGSAVQLMEDGVSALLKATQ
ncbi:MAG: ABC transporter substrate-binding protein [Limnochordia bacterium]